MYVVSALLFARDAIIWLVTVGVTFNWFYSRNSHMNLSWSWSFLSGMFFYFDWVLFVGTASFFLFRFGPRIGPIPQLAVLPEPMLSTTLETCPWDSSVILFTFGSSLLQRRTPRGSADTSSLSRIIDGTNQLVFSQPRLLSSGLADLIDQSSSLGYMAGQGWVGVSCWGREKKNPSQNKYRFYAVQTLRK